MMGWGDELIACGQAKGIHARTGRRVAILERSGQRRRHEAWHGVPFIATPGETGDFEPLKNCPGHRPYIAGKTEQQWTWKAFQCEPGMIALSAAEAEFAGRHAGRVIVEPSIKPKASPNKNWGWARWVAFAEIAHAKGITLTQMGPPGTLPLPHTAMIYTPDFRHACAILSKARAYVGHEGGLHHAAAAVGIPAVVIFGGFISPAQTGYTTHRNLFTGGEPCGMRIPCKHCAEAMGKITPEQVLRELEAIL